MGTLGALLGVFRALGRPLPDSVLLMPLAAAILIFLMNMLNKDKDLYEPRDFAFLRTPEGVARARKSAGLRLRLLIVLVVIGQVVAFSIRQAS